jgi:hypothetical protein
MEGGVDADEFQAKIADAAQQAEQVRLVGHRPGDGGLAITLLQGHSLERRLVALAQFATNNDLVDRRSRGSRGSTTLYHAARFAGRWMKWPPPSPWFI